MQYTTLLLALSATLVSSQQTVPEGYSWSVSNWQAGCTRTCFYGFNITGPAVAPYPSFTATCSGHDDGAFSSCEVLEAGGSSASFPSVLSLVAPSTGDGAHLQVSLLFDSYEDGLSYNITGAADATFNQFVAPPEFFEIVPTDLLTV